MSPELGIKEIPAKWIEVSGKLGKSGTLVVWSTLDRCLWKTGKTIIEHSEYIVGRMYRKFINSGQCIINAIVANEKSLIKPELRHTFLANDPMYLMKNTSVTKILKDTNSPSNDSSKLVATKLDIFIGEGLDLDEAVKQVNDLSKLGPSEGGISRTERNSLLKKIEDSRDFDRLIYRADFYRNIIEGDEAVITGVVKEMGRKVYYKTGYFVQLGVSETASDDDRKAGEGGVYKSITEKRGEPAALAFVNRRYNAYELSLREAFESKFKRYESDPAFTPEQAQEKIIEESQGIRDKIFEAWERESIIQANNFYDTQISMPQRLSVSGINRFRK